jgi:hypothetical protein
VRDAIRDFSGPETVEEGDILTEDGLEVFFSDTTTDSFAAYDPADRCDISCSQHADPDIE